MPCMKAAPTVAPAISWMPSAWVTMSASIPGTSEKFSATTNTPTMM